MSVLTLPRVSALLLALSLFPLAGCKSGGEAQAGAPAAKPVAVHGEHGLKCGCAIPEVGSCGEYVEVDGKYVPLELPADAGLGPMPFCGKEGLRGEVEGELTSGKVVARKFVLRK